MCYFCPDFKADFDDVALNVTSATHLQLMTSVSSPVLPR